MPSTHNHTDTLKRLLAVQSDAFSVHVSIHVKDQNAFDVLSSVDPNADRTVREDSAGYYDVAKLGNDRRVTLYGPSRPHRHRLRAVTDAVESHSIAARRR